MCVWRNPMSTEGRRIRCICGRFCRVYVYRCSDPAYCPTCQGKMKEDEFYSPSPHAQPKVNVSL